MTLRRVVLVTALTLLTGCSKTMNATDSSGVKIKLNPHPQQRYELTFMIHDAPGSFEAVDAIVQYEVSNTECVPKDLISGAKSKTPGLVLPLALERLNDQTYKAEAASDLPIDEDYFGLGVCHWTLLGTSIHLKVKSIKFNAGVEGRSIESQEGRSIFFAKESYASGTNDFGSDGRYLNAYEKANPNKFFSVVINAKRISP